MIGIVIVSHSARLAEGAAELARAAGPNARLATAGGLDLPGQPLGTDAVLILRAIEEVYSDDGVLVLMDLGSAILSAEMALDLLEPERRARVALCAAPLVEGAVVAAVQAGLGSPLEQVMVEALGALQPKSEHLASSAAAGEANLRPNGRTTNEPCPDERATNGFHSDERNTSEPRADGHAWLRLVVRNPLGLHARPAARLVQTAGRYEAEVSIRAVASGRGPVSARSINAVTTLGVRQGEEIELDASGPQAEEALAALQALVEANFGEAETRPLAAPPGENAAAPANPPQGRAERLAPGARLRGLAGSPGLVLGPARHVALERGPEPATAARAVADAQAEWQSLLAAIAQARAEIETARQGLAYRQNAASGEKDHAAGAADILSAHLLFLQDEALLGPAREGILSQGLAAARAWQGAVDAVAQAYRALDDPYLRSRAADVVEVGRQVLAHLPGGRAQRRMPRERGVLLADDLSAAEVAQLDRALVQGICTAYGAPTAHSTILARSLGLPAVVGLGDAILSVAEGTPVIVDGAAGEVVVDPDARSRAEHLQRAEAQRTIEVRAWESRRGPAVTRDGRRVQVLANIGAISDASEAMQAGAEGVGVLRTEFLFLDRVTAPDEEEQYVAYRSIAAALEGHPLTIRTLDVGGDKPLPYLAQPPEANPFLGWRAVRLSLERPEILLTQLTAILRTAMDYPVQVLLPMIATLGEWRACKGYPAGRRTVARARVAPAPGCAGGDHGGGAGRGAPGGCVRRGGGFLLHRHQRPGPVRPGGRAREPARGRPERCAATRGIRLIGQVVRAAHARNKPVAVCGELAGEPLAVPLLVGLGIDELSMNMAAVPLIKQIIRELDGGVGSQAGSSRLAARHGGRGSRGANKSSRP